MKQTETFYEFWFEHWSAFKSCMLEGYFDYSHRASPFTYRSFFLVALSFIVALNFAAFLFVGVYLLYTVEPGAAENDIHLKRAILGLSIYQFFLFLLFLSPSISVTVRRLHDLGQSGYQLWKVFIPIYGFVVLLHFVFFRSCLEGNPRSNAYGFPPSVEDVKVINPWKHSDDTK